MVYKKKDIVYFFRSDRHAFPGSKLRFMKVKFNGNVYLKNATKQLILLKLKMEKKLAYKYAHQAVTSYTDFFFEVTACHQWVADVNGLFWAQ